MFECPCSMCKWYAYLFNSSSYAISFQISNSICVAEQHCGSCTFCRPSQVLALRISMTPTLVTMALSMSNNDLFVTHNIHLGCSKDTCIKTVALAHTLEPIFPYVSINKAQQGTLHFSCHVMLCIFFDFQSHMQPSQMFSIEIHYYWSKMDTCAAIHPMDQHM